MEVEDVVWKKGDFVVNTRMRDEWGVGIVTQDEGERFVRVFFEHLCEVRKPLLEVLEKVDDPGASRTFLENALVDEDGKHDRKPFPTVLKNYLENFPKGFEGKIHLNCERNYKIAVAEWAAEHLNEAKWRRLLDEDQLETLAGEIKRLYTKTNLLASFELIKLNDALKDPIKQGTIAKTLFSLLYGKESMQERFESTAGVLGRYELDKWPIITYPLFMLFPEDHMFVKPEMTKEAASSRGFDIQYNSKLNWNTYNRVLLLANDLRNRLLDSNNPSLHARDMIDIQSFMWCTFGKGWTKDDVIKAKLKWGEEMNPEEQQAKVAVDLVEVEKAYRAKFGKPSGVFGDMRLGERTKLKLILKALTRGTEIDPKTDVVPYYPDPDSGIKF